MRLSRKGSAWIVALVLYLAYVPAFALLYIWLTPTGFISTTVALSPRSSKVSTSSAS